MVPLIVKGFKVQPLPAGGTQLIKNPSLWRAAPRAALKHISRPVIAKGPQRVFIRKIAGAAIKPAFA